MAQAFAVASCVASPFAETVQPWFSVVDVLVGLFALMVSWPFGVVAFPAPPRRYLPDGQVAVAVAVPPLTLAVTVANTTWLLVTPAGPVAPVGPCGPVDPCAPVAPADPCGPWGPAGPLWPRKFLIALRVSFPSGIEWLRIDLPVIRPLAAATPPPSAANRATHARIVAGCLSPFKKPPRVRPTGVSNRSCPSFRRDSDSSYPPIGDQLRGHEPAPGRVRRTAVRPTVHPATGIVRAGVLQNRVSDRPSARYTGRRSDLVFHPAPPTRAAAVTRPSSRRLPPTRPRAAAATSPAALFTAAATCR